MKKIVFAFALNFLIGIGAYSQAYNSSFAVDSIYNYESNNFDTIFLSTLPNINDSDIILIYQAKGVVWNYPIGVPSGDYNFTGRFEFHVVQKSIGKKLIIRRISREDNITYNPKNAVQVVRVGHYTDINKNLTLTGKITADKWDGSKGGIIAIIADTLDLKTNIDVSGCGFRGGDPGTNFGAVCWASDTAELNKGNFPITDIFKSGLKGEGVVNFSASVQRGNMPLYNGGGGGNGYHSGGGGGGCYYNGGNGGDESQNKLLCDSFPTFIGGSGGLGFSTGLLKYTDLNKPDPPLAVFGGGGGCGTQAAGFKATNGGNGGGIVIIMANAIKGNNFSIISNGQSVTDTLTAGAGGGGAGGTIILDINKYLDNLTVSLKGGDGGSYNPDIVPVTGPGGGGAGGFFRYNNAIFPDSIKLTKDEGVCGNKNSNRSQTDGSPGESLGHFVMPVKDFLFNLMPDNQEICAGDTADEIIASTPKGGTNNYRYVWRKRTRTTNWDSINNSITLKFKEPLPDTSYFQRIVHSLDSLNKIATSDTSYTLTIIVLPKIENNVINLDTNVVCETKPMPLINRNEPNTISGGRGIGTFTFEWQDFVTDWKTASGNFNNFDFQPIRHSAAKFKRIIRSGACISTSNIVTFTLLPKIDNNIIHDSLWVSMAIDSSLYIRRDSAWGGNGSLYYFWQKSEDNKLWQNEVSDSIFPTDLRIIKPLAADTVYVRRKIISGAFNTCLSYSNIVVVHFLDTISNNKIIIGTDTICSQTQPKTFVSASPSGGDKIYDYIWLSSKDSIKWDTIAYQYHNLQLKTDSLFNPGVIGGTTYFRRMALSGRNYCCKNLSNTIKIFAIPAIEKNKLINSGEQMVCYGQDAGELKAYQPEFGDTNYPYDYRWEQNTSSVFTNADGVFNTQNYQSLSLNDTILFRRFVKAGRCESYSDTLKIIVLQSLDNNTAGTDTVICKYETARDFKSSTPIGGNFTDYTYNWQYSNDNSTWKNCNDSTPQIYKPGVMDTSTYFRRIVYSGNNKCCMNTSSVVYIKVNELPSAVFESFDDSICLGSKITTDLTITGMPKIYVEYTDGYSNKTIEYNTTGTLQLETNPAVANIYNLKILKVTDDNNCTAKNIKGNGKLSVFEIPVANAGNDTDVCGDNVALHANLGIGKGFWSSSIPAILSPDLSTPIVNAITSVYDTIFFTWHLNNGGCKDSSKIQVIFYQPPPNPLVGDDTISPFIFNTKLIAHGEGTGKWTTPDTTIIIANRSDTNSYVDNLKFGKNIFQWHVINGVCDAASDSLIIEVIDIKIPQGFSPNNDNINDKFEIIGLDHVKNPEVIVLNRWGKEVYHSKDYKNDWDGTFNGNELPLDTYFYILNVIGKTYKGFVVIRR